MNQSRRAAVLGIVSLPMLPVAAAAGESVHTVLRRFQRSARLVAQGRPYREVMAEWGEFGELQQRHHDTDGGASWFPQNPTVYRAVYYRTGTPVFSKDGHVESVSPSDLILKIELDFVRYRVKLAHVERVFGQWYRDPPAPTKVSFASAYFNRRLIHQKAAYSVAAVSEAYAETLTSASPIDTIALTYGENRHVKANRPW